MDTKSVSFENLDIPAHKLNNSIIVFYRKESAIGKIPVVLLESNCGMGLGFPRVVARGEQNIKDLLRSVYYLNLMDKEITKVASYEYGEEVETIYAIELNYLELTAVRDQIEKFHSHSFGTVPVRVNENLAKLIKSFEFIRPELFDSFIDFLKGLTKNW